MRGMLGYLILFLLSKKPMHGQDELAKRRGDIYPALKVSRDF